jgi:hypothetical protein
MNMDEEWSSVKNKTCELPKTSKTKTTPKIFLVLLISTIVMLVTVSLLHKSMLVPLHLNLNHQISSAPDPEERQRNALVHEHHQQKHQMTAKNFLTQQLHQIRRLMNRVLHGKSYP